MESEEAVPQLEEAGDQQLDGSVIAAAPVPRVLPRHLQTLYPIALGPSCCCCILGRYWKWLQQKQRRHDLLVASC